MPKLQLLAYSLLIFSGGSRATKDGQKHFVNVEGFISSSLCMTLLISLGFPFAVREQMNPKLLTVSHCMRDEFQSIPLLHRTVMFSEVYFHIQLLVIQCLESRSYFSTFYTEPWKLATREGGQLLQNSCLLNIPAIPDNRVGFVFHENN